MPDVTIKLAVSVGVGMVIGFEREWSHRAGVVSQRCGNARLALTAILGMSSLPLVQRVVKKRVVAMRLWLLTIAIVTLGIIAMIGQHFIHF